MALIRVRTCQSIPEAVVARSMLEAYGIAVLLQGYGHARMAWPWMLALGNVGLLVPEHQWEAAAMLLLPRDGAAPRLIDSERFWRCPIRNGALAATVLWFCGLPLPIWLRESVEELSEQPADRPI